MKQLKKSLNKLKPKSTILRLIEKTIIAILTEISVLYFKVTPLMDIVKSKPELKQSLPALLIGNIVTSVVKNLATPLQIALAVFLRDSKEQVKAFSDFGVTCSYDELLRFKKSVAFTANANMDLSGLKSEVDGMIQGVGDNFDQQICSQNEQIWLYL